jgi:CspA family cold shock protein
VIEDCPLDSGQFWAMARGVVKFFNTLRGYGFIAPEGTAGTVAPDGFVHISDVQRSGLTTLSAGQLIEYDVFEDRSGRRSAQNLKLIAAPRR